MDYRLDCEARLADHYRKATELGAAGWKKPVRLPRYRVTVAQILVALAVRIAPTVAEPNTSVPALAR